MLNVQQIVNSYQHSCTYVISHEGSTFIWLIDCGDYNVVKDWAKANKKVIAGVFLTHGHFDHIYGLKDLISDYPQTPIYLSAHGGVECLKNPRLNISRFTSTPLVINSNYFNELKDGDVVNLYDDTDLKGHQTEGHSPDSIVFEVDKFLFTGDAYIPSLDVVTQLPGGNKQLAQISVDMIKKLIKEKSMTVMPGHFVE